MNDFQKQFAAYTQPMQDVAFQSVKAYTDVARIANELVLDLTSNNFKLGLDAVVTGEMMVLDIVKKQQEVTNSFFKTMSEYAYAMPPFSVLKAN